MSNSSTRPNLILIHNGQPAIRIVEPKTMDTDQRARNEIKFAIRNPDLGSLRKLLESRGKRLCFNEHVSTVRSVYFDDWQLSACQANLNGVGDRQKLRLRWYDSILPQNKIVLEIKWRRHRATGKHRLHLQTNVPASELSYRTLRNELLRVAPDEFLRQLWQSTEPTVLVEYRREHFASPDGITRMTLDRDLAFYDQTSKNFISVRFPRYLRDLAMVEVKGPVGAENELRKAWAPFASRVGGCSKYVHGCRLLGLIS